MGFLLLYKRPLLFLIQTYTTKEPFYYLLSILFLSLNKLSFLRHLLPIFMSLTMPEYEDQTKKQQKHQHNLVFLVQICLRATALGTSLAASCLTFTNKESALVYDVPMDAKYSYSSAFKFFAFATAVSSGFALVSLTLTLILRWKATFKANFHFLFFLHDLVMTMLMVGGTAGATAIGYVGKYGNDHAGWVPICDSFHKFCHKATLAIILAFLAFFCFLILTLISAIQSRYYISTAAQVQDI